jgi:prepilin-type N-terminal cleavage/methylation domain-containing protein
MRTYRFQQLHRLVRNADRAAGFSLLEVLIAITILTVGLTAVACLVAQTLSGTDRARYMGLATTLASEKLEDLNRWPSVDPHVGAGGSLTSDNAANGYNYFDDVDLSNTTGQVSETISTSTGYQSVIHKATGEVLPSSNTAAPTGSGIIAFHRRWLIEPSPVINGITLTGSRRVTVLVKLTTLGGINSAISFQMSLVRP